MNASEYAAHRNVKPAMVSVWIKGGFLEGAYRKNGIRYDIDVEAADRLLAENQASTQKDAKPLSYSEARTEKERLVVALRQMELDQKRGLLIPKEDVEIEAFECARQVRDAMLSIPGRVAAQLAATGDETEITRLLTTEIRTALQGVSE